MNWKKLSLYFLAPVAVNLTMVWMYFSGVEWLHSIVVPRIPGMSPTSQREFGLLENIQHTILLSMVVICVIGALKQQARIQRMGLWMVAVLAGFVFLEEIDYGLHYYEYAKGIQSSEAKVIRNWHNQGDRAAQIKRFVDILMVLIFVVAPFALMKTNVPLVRYLTPDRFSVLTLVGALLVRAIAHQLREYGIGSRGMTHNNLSEFREVMTYWVFFLFVYELSIRRHLEFAARGAAIPKI